MDFRKQQIQENSTISELSHQPNKSKSRINNHLIPLAQNQSQNPEPEQEKLKNQTSNKSNKRNETEYLDEEEGDLGEFEKGVFSEIGFAEIKHQLLGGRHFPFLVGLRPWWAGARSACSSKRRIHGGERKLLKKKKQKNHHRIDGEVSFSSVFSPIFL